ncbi:MAG TPA: cation:proton antiporter [Conexibacter sp.]|nr:cation:proton antiporter [Conexibacter sp.]
MDEELLGLALVVVLAIGAQLLAARLTIPAILPLLAAGVLAGDTTGLIDPPKLLGSALGPSIQIAVGIILFEGALGLRRDELGGGIRGAVTRLVSLGALLTWALMSLALVLVLDLPRNVGILVGAILIVSGPTVVLPMLEFIRPVRSARSLLKWEGILIDPVGAILAVVAFNALDFSGHGERVLSLQGDFVETMAAGLLCGIAGALVLMPLLAAGWLAERQKVAATLMAVVAAFAAGDLLKQDAGLVATIVMGVVLANQRRVDIARIVEFKETLGAILLGILFVLLAAQVQVSDVVDLGWEGIAVVLLAVVLVRPLVVLVATARTHVPWRERALAAGLAPRGIVAASTASVFGLELVQQGAPGADKIVPVTFLVIGGTVVLYAVAAPLLASSLQLIHGEPAGVLLIGAPPWARDLARGLSGAGVDVRVWSPRSVEADAARAAGLAVMPDPLLDDESDDPLAEEIGLVLVATDDDALNDALVVRLAEALGEARVHALPASAQRPLTLSRADELSPALFAPDATAPELERRFEAGARVAAITAAREDEAPPDGALPLLAVRERRRGGALDVHVFTPGAPAPRVRPGDVLLALA